MTATSPDPSISRHAWLVVALLVPVALLNYLDRQMLASMKFSVMQDIPDIGLEANWGAMLGQFKWVYAVLSPVGGYLADRYSPATRHRRQPVRVVAGDVEDRPCHAPTTSCWRRARSWASARRSTFPRRWP